MLDKTIPAEALSIRLRDGRDAADLFELFNQERFLRYASARGPFGSSEELQAWLANIACTNRAEVVAAIGDKTVGFGGLYVMGDGLSHTGWILLGVHDAYQARGIGGKLLHMLTAIASVTIGLRRVQMTVFADNEPAIKLYKRFGFEIEGVHRDFVRRGDGFTDALTMAKVYRGAPGAVVHAIDAQRARAAEIRAH